MSTTNYGFLNDLADAGIPVFGLAFGSGQSAIERHVSEWDVRFPILLDPEGSAVTVVPRYATPTLLVVSQGKVVYLGFGELGPEARTMIRSAAQG
jgi:hypothetical protein